MKRMIVVALAVLGVCMAATASASAFLFHASQTGTLLGLSTSNQVFTINSEGNAVTCKHTITTGSITALLALHQLVNVNYLNCTAFAGFVPVHISLALYLLSADGLAAIENTIKILALVPLAECTITVGPQDLGTVKYKNSGKNIFEESEVHSIKSTGTGGECGTANTGGTYTGSNEVMAAAGTLSWG